MAAPTHQKHPEMSRFLVVVTARCARGRKQKKIASLPSPNHPLALVKVDTLLPLQPVSSRPTEHSSQSVTTFPVPFTLTRITTLHDQHCGPLDNGNSPFCKCLPKVIAKVIAAYQHVAPSTLPPFLLVYAHSPVHLGTCHLLWRSPMMEKTHFYIDWPVNRRRFIRFNRTDQSTLQSQKACDCSAIDSKSIFTSDSEFPNLTGSCV